MRIPRYAIIPTNGRECLKQCLDAIMPQVDEAIVIWTKSTEELNALVDLGFNNVTFIGENLELNISKWWNLGLDFCRDFGHLMVSANTTGKCDVAIINDDVIVPEGWFDAVAGKMREFKAAAACSGGSGMPVLHTHSGPVPLHTRMQGFAFILAGESGLRADEQFRWYCGDDDLGWRAAGVGGMVMIPGFHVNHLYPNQQVTPEMQGLIAEDMQRFVDKWGQRPWALF